MEKPIIVCVDDQREVLTSVTRDLASLSAWVQIEECESADEAKELLEELTAEGKPVALILCDHIMPGTSGVAFLIDLARDSSFKHTRKVLLTGQATHKDTIEAVNSAQIDFYFEKPWQQDRLLSTCCRLVSEYLFDTGLYTEEFRTVIDPQVLLRRLSGRE